MEWPAKIFPGRTNGMRHGRKALIEWRSRQITNAADN